ncbi:MAG: hypothetical protein J6I71_02570 [Campylobacter sp.]|uniref:hypothetical protein n=1 Tax=Campylobacter sp. TaxID=205 RepID=UPI001B7CBD63|nr:hypothetical protein [Campylobacter sp.]MBP3675337.1 hypothetical protein [Campylobacter sp.]
MQDKLLLPQATANSNPSWFGFLMVCKDGVSRNDLVLALEKAQIQNKSIICWEHYQAFESGMKVADHKLL